MNPPPFHRDTEHFPTTVAKFDETYNDNKKT